MRRRMVITLLACLAANWPGAPGAQQSSGPPRIGFLGNSTAMLEAILIAPFIEGLRELGYVEGETVQIEYRWTEGYYARLPELIAELVAAEVDVLVTAGTPATLAVKKAATAPAARHDRRGRSCRHGNYRESCPTRGQHRRADLDLTRARWQAA